MKWSAMRAVLFAPALMLMTGCGGINLWPFGDSGRGSEISRVPSDAIAYHCDSGKRFHVRSLDNAAAVWLILPEREVRLNKVAAATGARYAAGKLTLEMTGREAALTDPPAAYSGCKIRSAAEEK